MSKKNRPKVPVSPIKQPISSKSPENIRQTPTQQSTSFAQKNWWMLLCIGIATFVAFIPSLQNGFVWDDQAYIVDSTLIAPLDVAHFKMMWTTPFGGNYHPLTMLSLAIERALVGTSPFLYHLDNLLIHILNSLLVFWLLKRLTHNNIAAFVAGLLFGIHPLHVESVAWATERKDVLYCLFLFLSLWFYLNFIEHTQKRRNYVLSLIFFICACLSKGMAVVFPLLVLLTDYFLIRRKLTVSVWLEKLPYFVVALITGIVAITAQREAGADMKEYLAHLYSASERFFFIAYGFAFYWVKMLLPVKLSLVYSYPSPNSLTWEYYAAPVVILVLLGLLYWLSRRNTTVAWGALFFLICILPVSQLLPVGSMVVAERYFYLSSVGPLFLLGMLVNKGISQVNWVRPLTIVAGIVVSGFFMFQTFQYSKVWKNQLTAFSYAVEQFPTSVMGLRNVGGYYFQQKDYANAIPYYQKAQQYSLSPGDLCLELGQCYFYTKNYPKAVENLQKAVDIKKLLDADVWMLGECYYNLGQTDKAIPYLQKAIAARPNEAQLIGFLGLTYIKRDEFDKAIPCIEKAIALNPQYSEAHTNLSFIYIKQKKFDKAIQALEEAVRLNPKAVSLYNNLAIAYQQINNIPKAIQSWKKSNELNPEDNTIVYTIGTAYDNLGNTPEAINWYRQAAKKGNTFAIETLKRRGISI